jgi:hypothetical protein
MRCRGRIGRGIMQDSIRIAMTCLLTTAGVWAFPAVDDADPRLERALRFSILSERTLDRIRADRGVPDAEREMTLEEVVEALSAGESWARFALQVRTETMSVAELKELAEHMERLAPTIQDPLHARIFASGAADALPGPLMLPVAEAALFDGKQSAYHTMAMMVGMVGRQLHPLPEAVPRLRELYWIAREDESIADFELQGGHARMHHRIIRAFGYCGEAGIDPILETGIQGESATVALGRIGTARALEILMEWCESSNSVAARQLCLRALRKGTLPNRPERVQIFVRANLTPYLSDADVGQRRYAVETASTTGDPHFLPYLIALRDEDPDERVRDIAKRGVEHQWRHHFGEANTALVKARYGLKQREQRVEYYEQQLADPKYNESHKARFAEHLDKAKAEREALALELAVLEAQHDRFMRGELIPQP